MLPASPTQPLNPSNALHKAQDVRKTAWGGLEVSLRVLQESSDMFPPLRVAVDGLLASIDILQVCICHSTFPASSNVNLNLGSGKASQGL
jgi:hypothetical protein